MRTTNFRKPKNPPDKFMFDILSVLFLSLQVFQLDFAKFNLILRLNKITAVAMIKFAVKNIVKSSTMAVCDLGNNFQTKFNFLTLHPTFTGFRLKFYVRTTIRG